MHTCDAMDTSYSDSTSRFSSNFPKKVLTQFELNFLEFCQSRGPRAVKAIVEDTEVDVFTCELCPSRQFLSEREFDEHLDSLHTERTCSVCGKTFPNKSQYDSHERERKFRCELCPRTTSFCFQTEYDAHLESIHVRANQQAEKNSAINNNVIQCDPCHLSFTEIADLKRHSADVHAAQSPLVRFECKLCGIKYPTKFHLATHLRNSHVGNLSENDKVDFKEENKKSPESASIRKIRRKRKHDSGSKDEIPEHRLPPKKRSSHFSSNKDDDDDDREYRETTNIQETKKEESKHVEQQQQVVVVEEYQDLEQEVRPNPIKPPSPKDFEFDVLAREIVAAPPSSPPPSSLPPPPPPPPPVKVAKRPPGRPRKRKTMEMEETSSMTTRKVRTLKTRQKSSNNENPIKEEEEVDQQSQLGSKRIRVRKNYSDFDLYLDESEEEAIVQKVLKQTSPVKDKSGRRLPNNGTISGIDFVKKLGRGGVKKKKVRKYNKKMQNLDEKSDSQIQSETKRNTRKKKK